jgi:hypothetical protein
MAEPSNLLYYGDNLDILRRYVDDGSIDLIYLDSPVVSEVDPPFNSNADYNVLFAEKSGEKAHAQIKAFEDTWEWDLEAAQEYAEVLRSGHDRVAKALKGVHQQAKEKSRPTRARGHRHVHLHRRADQSHAQGSRSSTGLTEVRRRILHVSHEHAAPAHPNPDD